MTIAQFFAAMRAAPAGGRLTAAQVEGTEAILRAWRDAGCSDRAQLAYMLATAYHETAATMQPVAEVGGDAYKTRLYDVTGSNPDRARRMGNDRPGDGIRYAGRGYVQLTWKDNYRLAGEKLGIDLVADPDLALQPAIAARILVTGMLEGWFTGRVLARYVAGDRVDYVGARRVVNGTDRAVLIAGYADAFAAAARVL